ncbi:MAG: hypothetical protein JWP73_2162 [Phenylobacterium sp.]|nr:hypothetical protein [Phenylobacterium sp.]
MTPADAALARPNGRAEDFSNVLSRVREKVSWPPARRLESLARGPRLSVGPSDKKMNLATDRVRAAPAISPTLSMNLGMTAIGLGLWGTLFPRHVARTLGIDAPTPVVRGVFGLRELWTGFALAGDPTKSGMLWARVAGDVFDIAVLKSLDNRKNPQRGAARAALGFVLAATALDVFTAVRMSNVKRNCE